MIAVLLPITLQPQLPHDAVKKTKHFSRDMHLLLCATLMNVFLPHLENICNGCELVLNRLLAPQNFKAEGHPHMSFLCAMWGPQTCNSKCESGGPILHTEHAHEGASFRTQLCQLRNIPDKTLSKFQEANPHILYESAKNR